MKKRLLVVTGAVVLLVALSTAVFADAPIKLIVNGRVVETDVNPQLTGDRVFVPVRWVAEALGAKVDWQGQTRSVLIDVPDPASLQNQVKQLEAAVAPAGPLEAAETWARGVKSRNGALQYAVLSPELKEQKRAELEGMNWVTGTSSPWVESYKIENQTQGAAEWECEVSFELNASTGPAGSYMSKVTVRQYGQNWFVAQIKDDSYLAEQLQEQVKGFLNKKYGSHYRVEGIELELLSCKSEGSGAEAEFLTKVTTTMNCAGPSDWPPQQGRINYLAENQDQLSPEKLQKVKDKIDFYDHELQQSIGVPGDNNEFLKVTADFDGLGKIVVDTVRFYSEDPEGQYILVREEDWPAFKTAAELIQMGYDEMRQLVEE